MLIVVAFLSIFSSPDINAVVDEPFTYGAHRGNSISRVENTTEAFREALDDERYKFIEFDIQYTKDKKIVVFHDLSLFRFQKQFIKVGNVTYEQLIDLSRYEVPLYEDVMDLLGDSKKLNIEIKSQGNIEDDKKMIEFVIEDCRRRGILENVVLSSISEDVVKYVASAHPEIGVGQIFMTLSSTYIPIDYFTKKLYDRVEESGADYLMLHGINLRNYESLMRLKPADKTLVFWMFDDQMYVVDGGRGIW